MRSDIDRNGGGVWRGCVARIRELDSEVRVVGECFYSILAIRFLAA